MNSWYAEGFYVPQVSEKTRLPQKIFEAMK